MDALPKEQWRCISDHLGNNAFPVDCNQQVDSFIYSSHFTTISVLINGTISLMKCLHTNLAQLKCCYCLTSPMTKWMCDTEKLKRFRWTQFTWREHFLPLNCHALFTVIRPYTATPTMLSHLLAKNNATVVITCKMPWARVALLYNSPTDVKSLARMLTRVNKTLLKRRNNTAWSYISSGQRNNAQY